MQMNCSIKLIHWVCRIGYCCPELSRKKINSGCTTIAKRSYFPSRFEGMGFPPVEAMRFGKPVFASTFSSIPEVSEGHAYYWENFEPEEMARFFLENLEAFYKDPSKPETLKKHSLKFTWEANLQAYLKLVQRDNGKIKFFTFHFSLTNSNRKTT